MTIRTWHSSWFASINTDITSMLKLLFVFAGQHPELGIAGFVTNKEDTQVFALVEKEGKETRVLVAYADV